MIAQPGRANAAPLRSGKIAHIDPAAIQTYTGSARGGTRRHETAPVCRRHGALQRRASAHVHGYEPMLRPSTRRLRAPPPHTNNAKKSSIGAASAAYTGPLRAESSSASPVVLAVVVVVDAIEPARLEPPLRGCA